MTRSHKANDRDHRAIAEGTPAQEFLPKYFGKHGFAQDPNKFKKNGGGKANWGNAGSEVDQEDFNFNHPRRRSNSNTTNARDFRTKFDVNEPEPVFEESVHGPVEDEAMGAELEKAETSASSSSSVA